MNDGTLWSSRRPGDAFVGVSGKAAFGAAQKSGQWLWARSHCPEAFYLLFQGMQRDGHGLTPSLWGQYAFLANYG